MVIDDRYRLHLYYTRDFNSWISDKHDHVSYIDEIKPRRETDVLRNVTKHVTPEYDNFTWSKSNEKSVFDYFIVPSDIIAICIEHKVYTMNCINDEVGLQHDMEDVSNIQVHSLLSLKITVENINSTFYQEDKH
jgi:hypothetical protein